MAELLQQDIDELVAQGLVEPTAIEDIHKLIQMSENNFEIAKGLYLISNFGHPNQKMFRRQVLS